MRTEEIASKLIEVKLEKVKLRYSKESAILDIASANLKKEPPAIC